MLVRHHDAHRRNWYTVRCHALPTRPMALFGRYKNTLLLPSATALRSTILYRSPVLITMRIGLNGFCRWSILRSSSIVRFSGLLAVDHLHLKAAPLVFRSFDES